MQYGRLTFVEQLPKSMWRLKCVCGNEHVALSGNVKKGRTQSCGCLQREVRSATSKTHGMSKTAEYMTWNRMWARCTNPVVERYPRYGGRGISVCERWKLFVNFYEDIGKKPSPKHSLGRVDNDGNYEPGNVRWETPDQQKDNTSTTLQIVHDGEKLTLNTLVSLSDRAKSTLYQRVKAGITGERLVARRDLRPKPITFDGRTLLTTEWIKEIPIPVSSFYLCRRKGMSDAAIIEKYARKSAPCQEHPAP